MRFKSGFANLTLAGLLTLLLVACGSKNQNQTAQSSNFSPVANNSGTTGHVVATPSDAWTGPEFLPTLTMSQPAQTPGVFVSTLLNNYNDAYQAHAAYLHQTFVQNSVSGLILQSPNGSIDTVSLPVIASDITIYTVCVYTGMGSNGLPDIAVVGTFAPNESFEIDQPGVKEIVIFFGNSTAQLGLHYQVSGNLEFSTRVSFNENLAPNGSSQFQPDFTILNLP